VTAKDTGDGWARVYSKDLKRALNKTRQAVRIGSVTIKPAILRELCANTVDPVIELQDQNGALGFRSADHKTRCTIRHGAGDPYVGRNGFEARIVLAH